MTARELSGRPLAAEINAASGQRVAQLAERGVVPALGLAVTDPNSSSDSYLRMIRRSAERLGIETVDIDLGTDPDTARDRLEHAVAGPRISGVIVSTPLPPGMELAEVAAVVPPRKDVDGASTQSLGRLMAGLPSHPPATAEAVVALLEHYDVELSGRHVVVVGRSLVVGKPLAQLLLARDATVTVCHSRTKELAQYTRSGDVVVAAAGRQGLISSDHVSPAAVVIDVGTNFDADGKVVGDVDATVAEQAAALSPVPGGVGPVTTALLLKHVVDAAQSGEAAGSGR